MKLLLIEWLDSHSGEGWQPLQKIEHDGPTIHCRSVGWLLCETKEYKVLVPHISGEGDASAVAWGSGDISIPAKAIVKVTVLQQR